jgi:hypothetical protein
VANALVEAVNLQRRQLAGLVGVRGVDRLAPLYAGARRDLRDRLAALVRRGRGGTFTAHQLRLVLAQVGDAAVAFEGTLATHVGEVARDAVALAPRHVVAAVDAGQRAFGRATPVVQPAQAAVFERMYRGVPPSLLDHHRASVRHYGRPVVDACRGALARSIVRGETLDQAVDRVAGTDGVFQGQRWRAERIARTELSYSYGVANQRALEELRPAAPRMMKRLVATHDDRTGDDSIKLDGQTVPVDQPFVWVVADSKGHPTGKVVRYMQPPNRPNDREVVVPWMADWPASGAPNT